MTSKEKVDHYVQTRPSEPTLEEIMEELTSSWYEPKDMTSEGVRRIVALANQGMLSNSEEAALLTYLIANFVTNEVDSMLFEEIYPLLVERRPTERLKRSLLGMLTRVLPR